MTRSDRHPLLFLDIDGPLIPFGGTGYPTYPLAGDTGGNPLLDRLDPALGPRSAALPCELVWATTWGRTPTRSWDARAAGRAFGWVDDEITLEDRVWVAANHPGPALLHRVDARTGLTDRDFTVLREWLRRRGS